MTSILAIDRFYAEQAAQTPRRTLEAPESRFRRIGIAAVAGALAASRPDDATRRALAPPPRDGERR